MSMNYADKLKRLNDRRRGLYTKGGEFLWRDAIAAGPLHEKYASLAEPDPIKYALGSMQRVGDEYTKATYAEGDRVKARLEEGLNGLIPVVFDYQGSVPLDVHVRGNSDIDLLLLHNGFFTYDSDVAQQYSMHPYKGKSLVDELQDLRREATAILKRRYPEVDVDTSGSKSINLSGGSLKRVVDVVPSHWHDTLRWRQTQDKQYREIYILDSHARMRLNNRPFMHMSMIASKCISVRGSLRKVIRLLKNLRYDADPQINLSSYDIAAIAWHMTVNELQTDYGMDLLLLKRAFDHLEFVVKNASYRNMLRVPDDSRLIFDKDDKVAQTERLLRELGRLIADISQSLQPRYVQDGLRADALTRAVYV